MSPLLPRKSGDEVDVLSLHMTFTYCITFGQDSAPTAIEANRVVQSSSIVLDQNTGSLLGSVFMGSVASGTSLHKGCSQTGLLEQGGKRNQVPRPESTQPTHSTVRRYYGCRRS